MNLFLVFRPFFSKKHLQFGEGRAILTIGLTVKAVDRPIEEERGEQEQ